MAVRADSTDIRKQFASVVEHDDAVAQQAPPLSGLIRHNPCCEVIGCRPFRAPRLMMTHDFPHVESGSWNASTSGSPPCRPIGRSRGHARCGILVVVTGVTACSEPRARPDERSSHYRGDFCLANLRSAR
jgi:hypothetical protein